MNLTEELIHTTVLIETNSGVGTGFFINFDRTNEQLIPCVVTNKHVIDKATRGDFRFTMMKEETGKPDYGNFITITLDDFENRWIDHPDPDIDLAVMPIAGLIDQLELDGKFIFFKWLGLDDLISDEEAETVPIVSDILMIGYPIGIWDQKNNLPIVRHGILASSLSLDFNGDAQFVVDCACYPGSSGSPIFLYNPGVNCASLSGTQLAPSSVKLLGLLWGGPQYTPSGDVISVPAPTRLHQVNMAHSMIPTNLGYCIKAQQMLWFENYFRQQVVEEAAAC